MLIIIKERGSVLYLGMAVENFEFTIVMYHPDNGPRSYKPQTKHAERMILPSSSQNTRERTVEYAGAEKQTPEKVGFRRLSSFYFSYKTLD